MAATDFGPQYCETPAFGNFPIEPANTVSSGVIVLFGIAALVLVMRRAPRDYALYAACAALIVNGVGSILWHGLRTPWALALDTFPALLFVLIVAFLWARRVAPLWQAVAVIVVLVVLPVALFRVDFGLPPALRLSASAASIALVGIWLVARTFLLSPRTAFIGGGAIACGVAALTFRIADSQACAFSPVGSHFLWHIFLSSAAFLCMVTLLRLRTQPAPSLAPA